MPNTQKKPKGFAVILSRTIKHPRSGESINNRVYIVLDPQIRLAFGKFPSIDAGRSNVLSWSGDDLDGRKRIFGEALKAGYNLITEDQYLSQHGY